MGLRVRDPKAEGCSRPDLREAGGGFAQLGKLLVRHCWKMRVWRRETDLGERREARRSEEGEGAGYYKPEQTAEVQSDGGMPVTRGGTAIFIFFSLLLIWSIHFVFFFFVSKGIYFFLSYEQIALRKDS